MLRLALFGAGRIGRRHAETLAANPKALLVNIYDPNEAVARETAEKFGGHVSANEAAALRDGDVDAVLIASTSHSHVDLIITAAKAGKAIFCEKPIDLDIHRVDRCLEEIRDCDVPIQLGFMRRYDPSHRAVHDAARDGEVGKIELVVISSRDPEPASLEYLMASGGQFRDQMIHDFDLARWLLGEELVEISAMGSNMILQELNDSNDVDTSMVVMKAMSGALCHINNSRRAVYGYDQRVEVFGSKGMVRLGNRRVTMVSHYTKAGTVRDPLAYWAKERYGEAYQAEINDFIDAVERKRPPAVGFDDGRRALILADAAVESLRSSLTVKVDY